MSSLAPERIGQMRRELALARGDQKQAEVMRSMGRHYSALGHFAARTLGELVHTSDIERMMHVVDPRGICPEGIEQTSGDPAHT